MITNKIGVTPNLKWSMIPMDNIMTMVAYCTQRKIRLASKGLNSENNAHFKILPPSIGNSGSRLYKP